jgi:hypothetical protein
MQALRNWSFARVLLLSGGWILVCVLATAAWLFFWFRNVFEVSTGSGGIGAVSFGINALVLAIPIAPPVILIVAWLIAHRY